MGDNIYGYETNSDIGYESNDETPYLVSATHIGSYIAINDSDQHERRGNILTSTFTLVSTMIGGGLLSLPFAFQQGGFGVSSFVLVFVLMASTHGGFLIINSKKYCKGKIRNIEDVANVAFGKKGQVAVQILLILLLFLSSVAYFILIVDQLKPLVEFISGRTGTIWSEKIILLSFAIAIVFPLSLLKNLTALKYTSSMSVFCGLLLCGCVAYRSFSAQLGGRLNDKENPIKWYPTNLRQTLTSISIAELTFSCHFNILPMHSELRYQTRKNKRVILVLAMGITYIMNFIVSFFGYAQFRKYTDEDITKNYDNNDIVVSCGRAALCLLLITSYPLLIVPCRATINKIFWHTERDRSMAFMHLSDDRGTGPNRFVWFLETVMLVGLSYLLAYFVPQVNMIWGFVGSLGCTVLVYIIPPVFYLRVRKHPERPDAKKVAACALLTVGVFMFLAGLYQSVMNIVSPIPILRPQKQIIPSQNLTNTLH